MYLQDSREWPCLPARPRRVPDGWRAAGISIRRGSLMADKEDRPEVRGGLGTEERQRKVSNPSERVLARRGGVARGGPTPLAVRGQAPPRGAAAAAAAMKTLGGFLTARILVVDHQEASQP